MEISMIVAIGNDGQIGLNNSLLWHIKEDLQNFKKTTLGRHILMGRRTYESIGRPLPGRTSIVLSRKEGSYPEGVLTAKTLKEGLALARERGEKELFIIGGGEIYKESLKLVNKIYLTQVDYSGQADTFFPKLQKDLWHTTSRDSHPAKDKSPAWSFSILKRKSSLVNQQDHAT